VSKIRKIALEIESSRSCGRSLLQGIADYARVHGPWFFYWETGGLEKAWPALSTLDVDGVILRDVGKAEDLLVSGRGVPAIVVGHSNDDIPGIANVITDSSSVATMAAEHLIECGLRQFAFCGLPDKTWSGAREKAFCDRTGKAGFRAQTYASPGPAAAASWATERKHMAEWLHSLPKPIGVMACNDDRGHQVIEACKMAGLRVPDDVSVIGADDDELVCSLSDPHMSSVAINFEQAGYEAARLLERLMDGDPGAPSKIMVPALHVVPRPSTDVLFVDDPQLARALRFIRDNARQSIQVDDVARAAGLSRRVLEKRFRSAIDRSVLDEIRRVRVDWICRVLVETNQPISEIALASGYPDALHFARYFRRERAMSPLEYRRKHRRASAA
jgi:LacI family transcriptional regulator